MGAERAIAIIRVSQRDKDAQSPEVQRRAIVRLAEEHGWSLRDEDILDENVDDNGKVRNVSGSWELQDRPKLRYAIDEIEAGRAKVIVGERFDRIFRNELLRRMVVKRLEDADGELWSDKGGQMTNQRAEGRLAHNVNGDVSEYTLETARERSWDAVELAIEQGKSPAPVPPGYVRQNGGLVTDDGATVKVVQQAFDLRDGGASVKDVQAFLARHGIKRSQRGVRVMLSSRLYLGEVHFGKHTPNLTAHEPIIDRDVFERVQKMVVPAGRKPKSQRLLARLGVLRCGTCGGRMSVSKTGTGYVFYRCGTKECSRPVTISADPIEAAVIAAVIDHHRSIRGQARGEQRAAEAREAADAATKTHADFVAILDPSEPSHVDREAGLRADRDAKRERADQLEAAYPATVERDVEGTFATGSLAARRALIRDTVERVTVDPGRGSGRVTIKLR
jgi:DNA invertase Pin-like site-specific DNA recombinase